MSIKHSEEVYNIIRIAEQKLKNISGVRLKLYLKVQGKQKTTRVKLVYEDPIPELLPSSYIHEGHILICAAKALDMPSWIYKKKTRDREVVHLKFIAAYIIKQHYFPATTLKAIGGLFGGQDHSTVISQIEKAQSLLDALDGEFCAKYVRVVNNINKYIKSLRK